MQSFADPQLTLCGRDTTAMPTPDILNLLSIPANEQERRGLNSVSMGLVIAGPLYISAHGYFDAALTGVQKIRLRAWRLTDDVQAWTLDFALRAIEPNPTIRFSSNFFFDPDVKTLNIAYLDLYTIQLAADFITPPTLASLTRSTPGDVTYMTAAAWDAALIMDGTTGKTVRKNDHDNRWAQNNSLNIASLFPAYTEFSQYSKDFVESSPANRGAPYSMDLQRFVVPMLVKRNIPLEDTSQFEEPVSHAGLAAKMVGFRRSGGYVSQDLYERSIYSVTDLSSLADAATADMATYPTFQVLAAYKPPPPPLIGIYPAIVTNNHAGALMPDGGQYSQAVTGYSNYHQYRAQRLPSAREYLCPQLNSGNNPVFSGDARCIPGAVLTSTDLAVVAGMYVTGILRYATEDLQYNQYEGLYSEWITYGGESSVGHTESWVEGTGIETDPEIIRIGYWDIQNFVKSIPKHTYSHETLLKWIGPAGDTVFEHKINQKFAGLILGCTEEVDLPENVWSIAVGQRAAGSTWKDAVFALHDWRDEMGKLPRRVISVFDSAPSFKSMVQLSPLDLDGAGQYLYEMEGAEIRLSMPNDGDPGDVYLIARTLARDRTKDPSDADYYRHDLIVWDIFDLSEITEVNRLTEYSNFSPATTMPAMSDMNRIAIGGGRILYTSTSDYLGWSVKEII